MSIGLFLLGGIIAVCILARIVYMDGLTVGELPVILFAVALLMAFSWVGLALLLTTVYKDVEIFKERR